MKTDTLPIINGAPDWTAVRKAKNWQDNGFVSDVTSNDIRCNQLNAGTDTVSIAAGDKVSITFNNDLYHPGPVRKSTYTRPRPQGDFMSRLTNSFPESYMAKVPEGEDVNTWDPTDAVWFKVYQDSLVAGASTSSWTSDGTSYSNHPSNPPVSNTNTAVVGKTTVDIPTPSCLAPGDYLMRNEQIALHVAQSSGGAQFYLSCGQVTVTGSGTAEPSGSSLVAFPGAYKATDPGILININYPVLTSYTNPGPAVFTC